MQGKTRKVVQAILYETIAVLCVAPVLSWVFDASMAHSTALSLILSAVALAWNMFYNWAFEYWEARQALRTRTFWRRLIHALGFEGGLVLILLPVVAGWLQISLWVALLTNLGLFAFFFVYAFVFQWAFDRLFDVPDSAREPA
ncbi:PACE efflux transporter [Pseudomonas rubra]|uniref:PACE efflux transporter n=1 Tax=Pseudomonas rubra TaxID=2942627 RepID=A0ABT5P2X9_9PSED|nr:PACE efflux transporter [Pseudomonas rubra]MDD1012638.1 PACE efflux transporter [Pseudomonas rubra]MDD1037799.1 PACE efflux transporter [Pseudomonas rubra]MDD1157090.1 PACE efflux transporter [Pseudomonas rubra]